MDEMKRFTSVDTSVLKQHYEKKVHELKLEKRVLQKEIEDLRQNLANLPSISDDGAQKLKEEYLQKLNVLEAQVSELKKKQDAQAQLLRQKQKSDEAAKRLQGKIHRIKSQKVQLQQKIKQESEQFRLWKASREKQVLQLKTARDAVQFGLIGSAIGAVSTAGVSWKYSRSLHGAGLSFLAGAVFGWTFGHEVANHWYQLYRVDTMAAQVKFMEWWQSKSQQRS